MSRYAFRDDEFKERLKEQRAFEMHESGLRAAIRTRGKVYSGGRYTLHEELIHKHAKDDDHEPGYVFRKAIPGKVAHGEFRTSDEIEGLIAQGHLKLRIDDYD